jgi:glycosyltransferase involved in cell wall biosynthesis
MKFSVLIPTYKDQFLKDCIDSVLSQTYTDFEVIIVNDASPFSIDSIIAQYQDSRIKYYKNEKGYGAENVVENWNKCLSYADGDYTICMGDDDMLLPHCLDMYHHCILSNPDYEIYHVRTEVINEKGETINLQEARPEHESVYSLIWHKLNTKRIQFIGDFCFKTNPLRERGGFYELPFACFSDDISVYLAAMIGGIRNINELGFQYRSNSLTISNTQNLRGTIIGAEKAFELIKSYLDRKSDNSLDEIHRFLSLKILPDYASNLYFYCIQTDISQSPIKGLKYWKGKTRKYGISTKMLIKIIWKSIPFYFKRGM